MRIAQLLCLVAALTLAIGCTTAHKIYDKKGNEALLIECGSAVSQSVCHDRAKTECPKGYKVLSEHRGLNRQEIKVRCKGK